MYKYNYQPNNLDLLRLILASAVVILHLSHLTQNTEIYLISSKLEFISSRAVQGFFIISGFLIYMSFDKSSTIQKYFISRVLRIYPALIFLLILCSLLYAYQSRLGANIFISKDWYEYVFSNLIFLNFIKPTLPGLFETNYTQVINGSLWTLKIEVMFYVLAPLLYFAIMRFGKIIIVSIYILSIGYKLYLDYLIQNNSSTIYISLSNQLPAQMSYFISGVLAYIYFEKIKEYKLILTVFSLIVFLFQIQIFEPIALMFSLVFIFMLINFKVNIQKIGDISYGVYIYHFPIIQYVISIGFLNDSPLLLVFFVYFSTFILAYISWVLIEKKAISLKGKLYINRRKRIV